MSFTSPIENISNVTLVRPLPVRLSDPDRTDSIIARQNVSRYASSSLLLMEIVSDYEFNLLAPSDCVVRRVDVEPITGGPSQLLELSVLPFSMVNVLRALPRGVPTLFLGFPEIDLVEEDSAYSRGHTLATITENQTLFMGVIFQDGVELAPLSWISEIDKAMTAAGEESASWLTLAQLFNTVPSASLRVLDHLGRPLSAGAQFEVRLIDGALITGPFTVTLDSSHDSDLEKAVQEIPSIGTLFPTNKIVEIRWNPPPVISKDDTQDLPYPIHCVYETNISVSPENSAEDSPWLRVDDLPEQRGHVQVSNLAQWFSPRPSTVSMLRFHSNNRLEPLIDNVALKQLAKDLLAAQTDGFGAHFSGWAFRDFKLDPKNEDTQFVSLIEQILSKQSSETSGGVRLLVNKFIMPKDPQVFADDIELFLLLVAASSPSIISLLSKFKKKEEGLFAVAAISVSLIALLTALLVDPVALAEGLIEEGLDVRNQIEDIHPGIAIWAKHPARTVDNPVSNIPATLENIVDRFGTWHAKYQLVYRPVSPEEPNEYIAYLGGIDVNDNRVDPPGHQTNDLFHDVHARLTGPVAADVFSSFAERYDFDRSREGGATTLAIDTPLASDLLVQDNKHIVQIGRTYFKPSSSVSSDPFPFAPEGEVSINDSLIRAIESARQYIYIEDQYFTPNDSSAEDESKRTIYDALLSAKDHCERLLIIGPDGGGGQPFGEDRRRFLLKELAAQWGSHFAAGVPMRRPLLNNSGTTASKGRCILSEGIDDSNDDKIKLKPPSRVPGPGRFWLWINGELMLGTNVVKYTDHAEVEVIRSSGSQGRWGVKPRKHPPGAAVTLAQLRGIFVHTKAVIVDDVFVSIGSANLNRRGLFHDGEIAALCVPERLKSSTDNPALILRTSLWAEHLGLPPGMGMTLLRDPIAAFDLFFRSRYGGNRFVPMEDLDFSGLFGISPTDNPILSAALVKLGFIGPTATALEFIVGLKKIWHSIIDPTTGDDPSPSSGPIDFDE